MIAFSHSWSWDWLNKGLADYFIVYPEYYGPQSNFIRPVSNFLYWLFPFLIPADAPFLANKIQLLVLNFGTHAAICACLYALALRIAASRVIAFGIALIGIAMPPFWTTPAPSYSSFVFDELAVLFCLMACLAWQGRRIWLMTLGLTLALLTKEISLPIICGFLALFVVRKQWLNALQPVIALMIWSALRLHGFGLHAEGLYVFETSTLTLTDVLKEKLFNALTLPLGPVFFDTIFTADGVHLLHRDGLILLVNLTLVGVSAALLLPKLSGLAPFLSRWFKVGTHHSDETDVVLLSLFVCAFSFAFDAYIGANYRYALNLIPFLTLAIAGLTNRSQLRALLVALLIAGGFVASAPSLKRFWNGSDFETYRYKIMRSLFAEIRAHQDSKTLIIANDFVSGYANPDAYEILAPTTTQILRGTSLYLDSCPMSEIKTITTHIVRKADEMSLTATIPDCARFTFESSPKLQSFISGPQIKRNDQISYDFAPDVKWTGQHLTMTARNADLIYFDLPTSKWMFVSSVAQ